MKHSSSMAAVASASTTLGTLRRSFLVSCGFAVCLPLALASPALAAPQRPLPVQDADGDGLHDEIERARGLAFDRVDTDYDGWNDAEELARGSLPNVHCSQPQESQGSIGSAAYVRNGRLHVALAIYVRSGTLENTHLQLGIMVQKRLIPISPAHYSAGMTVTTVPTHDPEQLLLVTDVIISDLPLQRTGAMSIYATLRIGDLFSHATVLNLVLIDGTLFELVDPSQVSPLAAEQLGPGFFYRPLGGSSVPAHWSSGEICFQRMEAVGCQGAVVTQEVTSASCVSGWDGYCDAGSCSGSVGSTVDLVDPATLIGG